MREELWQPRSPEQAHTESTLWEIQGLLSELTHQCQECEDTFETQQLLSTHVKKRHTIHQCGVCDAVFPTPSKLKHHLVTHQVRYTCLRDGCSEGFSNIKQLQLHIRSSHPHKCRVCEKVFTRRYNLEEHYIATGHDGGHSSLSAGERFSRRIFDCQAPGCGKSFITVYTYHY